MIVVTPEGETVEVETPTPQQAQFSYLVSLIGADGVEWDLNNGPATLMAGVQGLFDPPLTQQWLSTTIGVPGSRYTGGQVEAHDMTLPIRTVGLDAKSWRDVDRAFLRSLRDDALSLLRVTSPWGDVVEKPILREALGIPVDDTDPLLRCRRIYQDLTVVAPQPYWQMKDVAKRFTFSNGLSFFTGRYRFLSSSSVTGNATLTNPGEVPVFTRAVVTGPSTSWSVGVGEKIISSETPLAANEHVYIDGRTRSIKDDDGARAYKQMDRIGFGFLPPGVDVPIVATMEGYSPASRIDVVATPLVERPT